MPAWTKNAKYVGKETVGGVACDKFSIQGVEPKPNFLSQTTDASQICELNNGGHDKMEFIRGTWKNSVDPSYFALPPFNCSQKCGDAPQPYDCKSHYLKHQTQGRR
jgi:hypothetical protein